MYHYALYGIQVASERRLDGLLPSEIAAADVTIRDGTTPDDLPNPTGSGVLYQIAPRDFLLTIPDVARYHVHDGRTITIQPESAADDASIHLFLLGSALGALLHQRGLLPLHASAVETPRGAMIFSGVSGAGKSTTAAALNRRGYALIADDIAVIYPGDDGQPLVAPAFPQMKLWVESLEKLETASEGLSRIRPELEKYALPAADRFRAEPMRAAAVYLLAPAAVSAVSMQPSTGMNKLRTIRNLIYRRRLMEQMGADAAHFAAITALLNSVRVSVVSRPQHPFMLDELIAALEADFNA